MPNAATLGVKEKLVVPTELQPQVDTMLPRLTHGNIAELAENGWSRVGLMVSLVTVAGNVLMLRHNGRSKNDNLALGPLGETSQASGPVIEQPIQTLWRGLREELGIENPDELHLRMPKSNGWVINQWPVGKEHPGEYACAISFSAFVDNHAAQHVLDLPHGSEEIAGLQAMPPKEILHQPDASLRPGVKPWLQQLGRAGLLSPTSEEPLVEVDFSGIYEASLRDIELSTLLVDTMLPALETL